MPNARKIVVEALIPASVETVWERTQEPELHVAWDIRFDQISYAGRKDERGYELLDYRTGIGFGVSVRGYGHYLQTTKLRHSSFEFDSKDWKSLIRNGRGIWLYEPRNGATYFKTVYDYDVRHGILGQLVDRFVFRRVLQLATEWGFETLRQWCAGDRSVLGPRRSRKAFIAFFVRRMLGRPPEAGAARSWLGRGREGEEPRGW
jgi:hypothetical protein